jgi:hypothetical protein
MLLFLFEFLWTLFGFLVALYLWERYLKPMMDSKDGEE